MTRSRLPGSRPREGSIEGVTGPRDGDARVAVDAAVDPGLIFVSHSRWDRPSAMRLVSRLQDAGLRTWISGPELHCPAWQDTVFPHIDNCAAVVVVASGHAAAADGVIQEIAYAKRLGKPVIPFPQEEALTPFPVARTVLSPKGARRHGAPGRSAGSGRVLCTTPGSS
ncbi:toll/interleukin-1 receptor domain-containing protein [Streptomyces mirabilis]